MPGKDRLGALGYDRYVTNGPFHHSGNTSPPSIYSARYSFLYPTSGAHSRHGRLRKFSPTYHDQLFFPHTISFVRSFQRSAGSFNLTLVHRHHTLAGSSAPCARVSPRIPPPVSARARDAPPNRLSPHYPEPPPHPTEDGSNFSEQPKLMSAGLVKAAKQFDALVAALPISEGGEEAQIKRIADLQAENDAIGQELQKQLEAAEKELNQVQDLFKQASDNCLNLKKPE
ncbi:Mediator of RNA polymerase II transcription subunit [Arachis hypogaea]|nr:Mediator of RNA polymerase II transcription subunit [Arachis hypogaea]